ncbi:nwd2 [Moniliophthora roreri MCA 2997]|uniref:Nwd2 n=1 Tax=Moniliophthora roreri (strain MCA 2997) TaxID=1381753 RepID=V2X1A4_MONRO|nr:nwd2 [Moniliophthora roreri MCA 2997]
MAGAFHSARDFDISGGTFNVIHGVQNNHFSAPDDVLRFLAGRASGNAAYNAGQRFPPPKCHPGTRVKVLEALSKWIEDDSKSTRVYWLHGPVGVGKSAIAQTLSEKYASTKLAAAFFFSRNDATRNELDSFVATIAYQFCTSDTLRDVVGPLILEAIRSNPRIFDTSVENQFLRLLLEPFSKLTPAQRQQLPNLIVVDGLDECVYIPSQERLLMIIGGAIAFSASFPFIFLICSRPEPTIVDGFDDAGFASNLKRLSISYAYKDIQKYLVEEFARLRKKYRAALQEEDESWPGEGAIWALVRRACGQFIFAATVIKYIDNRDELPQDRLKTILTVQPGGVLDSPYPDLDLLYRQILSMYPNWDRVRPILRLLVTPDFRPYGFTRTNWYLSTPSFRSKSIIAALLKLRVGEVETSLSRLHSMIYIPPQHHKSWDAVHILHASFAEFLLDSTRSGEYHTPVMSLMEYWDLVGALLLREFSSYTRDYPPYCMPRQSFLASFEIWQDKIDGAKTGLMPFALDHWSHYCTRIVGSPSDDLLVALDEFDPYSVLTMLIKRTPGVWSWEMLWNKSLKWAQFLGERAPKKFISRLESFFSGFHIGLAPEPHPRTTLELEKALFGSMLMRGPPKAFLVLPPAMDTSILPENWLVAHIAFDATFRNSGLQYSVNVTRITDRNGKSDKGSAEDDAEKHTVPTTAAVEGSAS